MQCARIAAEGIRRAQDEHGNNIAVLVRGNSGVSGAFAALAVTDFNLCLLRKREDNSHGSPLEGPYNFEFTKYVILDDFVSSGETVNGMIHDLTQLALAKGAPIPECVGLVLYANTCAGFNSEVGRLQNYTKGL